MRIAPHGKTKLYCLGEAIAAAAEQRVDSTPIEGFLPEKIHELLKLQFGSIRIFVVGIFRKGSSPYNEHLFNIGIDMEKPLINISLIFQNRGNLICRELAAYSCL